MSGEGSVCGDKNKNINLTVVDKMDDKSVLIVSNENDSASCIVDNCVISDMSHRISTVIDADINLDNDEKHKIASHVVDSETVINNSLDNPLASESNSDETEISTFEGNNVLETTCDIKRIEVEIKDLSDNTQLRNISPGLTVVNSNDSSAFSKCQKNESGTEDSESDSSSSDSEESESSSSSEESKQSNKSSSSDEDIEEPVQKDRTRKSAGVKENPLNKEKKRGTKYKDELDLDELPPIEDLHITVPEEQCEPLGTVCSIVNQLVVIESLPNKPALNLDSLLFKKLGECLGQIFDVFGPVKTPFYTLRFNSRQEIVDKGIEVGQTVYCAPQTPHTKYVFVYQLMQQKGSDASWKHNYEVPSSLQEYSDDEEERVAKRKNFQKTRGRPNKKDDYIPPSKRKPIKSEFEHDQYLDNEWYRARVSELNQFSRRNRSRHQNYNYQSTSRNQFNGPVDGCGQPFHNMSQCSSLPPPVLRVPPPNNSNGPPHMCPMHPAPSHFSGIVQNCTNSSLPSGQFSVPPPFNCHSQVPYERLNSPVNFRNPMQFNGGLLHQGQWTQQNSQLQHSFRGNNSRASDMAPSGPAPFSPQSAYMNMRPAIPLQPPAFSPQSAFMNMRPGVPLQPPPPGIQESINNSSDMYR